jgi:hypothetical protein
MDANRSVGIVSICAQYIRHIVTCRIIDAKYNQWPTFTDTNNKQLALETNINTQSMVIGTC